MRRRSGFAAVSASLANPMYRNALALAANTGITSLLGFAYWVLAARYFSATVVGETSALLSTLLVLATIAELNLCNVLIRFLPNAGPRTATYVARAYVTGAVSALVVGGAALPFLRRLPLVEVLMQHGIAGVAWFLAAVVAWCLFALQDSAATGVRAAVWVPADNAFYGVTKLILLVALAGSAPHLGILISWTLPMAVTLVPMGLLLFLWLVPRHGAAPAPTVERVGVRDLAGFMSLDHITVLTTTALSALLPLIVTLRAGGEASAYFFVAWTIATALDVALFAVASSLLVEGARQQSRLPALVRAMVVRIVALAVPLVVLIVVAAPWILSLYGPAYAVRSTTLLRLVAVALLPRIVVVVWMTIHRVRRRVGRVLAVQLLLTAAVLGGSTIALGHHGIVAVGLINLAAQGVVAVVLLADTVRVLRRMTRAPVANEEEMSLQPLGGLT